MAFEETGYGYKGDKADRNHDQAVPRVFDPRLLKDCDSRRPRCAQRGSDKRPGSIEACILTDARVESSDSFEVEFDAREDEGWHKKSAAYRTREYHGDEGQWVHRSARRVSWEIGACG